MSGALRGRCGRWWSWRRNSKRWNYGLNAIDRLGWRFYDFDVMKPAKWMLMGLLVVLLALPVGVQGQDYRFETNGNAFIITKYIGAGGAVTIPEKINGMPVTSIGNLMFIDGTNLISVTIPVGVTRIGGAAFRNCTKLISITIPNSVTSIEDWAFWGCKSLANITIPNGVTNIGSLVFRDCKSLTSITIPSGVTNIGHSTFGNCNNLTSVTIPNSVTHIDRDAFVHCVNLTSITIPSSVISIGDTAFIICTNLTGVYFRGNAPSLSRDVFAFDNKATIYYLPTTTGWGKTFGGRPTAVWKQ